MFETQKSRKKTSSGDIGLNIRTLASPKVGQDQVQSHEKLRQVWEKYLSQQVKHMQVPNGTEPVAWRNRRPLPACLYRCKLSIYYKRDFY